MSETTENAVTDTTKTPDSVDQASAEQKNDLARQTARQSRAEAAKVDDAADNALISDASKEATPTEADSAPAVNEPTVAVKLNQEWYDATEAEGDVTVSTATGTYELSAEAIELPASEAELVLASPAAERA